MRAGEAELRVRRLTRASAEAVRALADAVAETEATAHQLTQQESRQAAAYRSLEDERLKTVRVVDALTVHAEGLRLAIQALAAILRQTGRRTLGHGSLWMLISAVAQAYGLSPDLVWAVVMTESGGNPGAVSPTGAVGLMQLEPGTARALGVSNPYSAKENLKGGVAYLAGLIREYHGNVAMALAAYNGGPGAVASGRIPSGEEGYVQTVMGYLTRAKR
jgi:soluble lytic murein transglycosylase-like protein